MATNDGVTLPANMTPTAANADANDVAFQRAVLRRQQGENSASVAGMAPSAVLQPGEVQSPSEYSGISPLASPMAAATVAAGQTNKGGSKEWAQNVVAGVETALSAFGAGGKAPAGSGAAYGVGAAARQFLKEEEGAKDRKQAEADRQEELKLRQRELTDQEKNSSNEYQLRLAENARQQASDVRQAQEHDIRMKLLGDEHTANTFDTMNKEVEWRQKQLDYEDALHNIGAKPLDVLGKPSPSFDHLGDLETYASTNNLAKQAHQNGYRTRAVFGADNKWRLYEVPDNPPSWHTVKDPDGNSVRIFGDPLAVLNYQQKVAEIGRTNAVAHRDYATAQREYEKFNEEGTVKKARADLSAVGGDYSKLQAGDREALRPIAEKNWQLAFGAYQAAERDMRLDPRYTDLPPDPKTGDPDPTSEPYQELASEYHVDTAREQLDGAYTELRGLGFGYKAPGATPAKAPPKQKPQYNVGQIIIQNGHKFKVTGVSPDHTKVTGGQPVPGQ